MQKNAIDDKKIKTYPSIIQADRLELKHVFKQEEDLVMKHKVVRIDNLMYNGCEPHWKCTRCGKCVPFHCYTKEQFENQECNITDKQNKSEVDKLIELFQDTEHKHWLRDNADMKEFAEYLVSRGVHVKRRNNNG